MTLGSEFGWVRLELGFMRTKIKVYLNIHLNFSSRNGTMGMKFGTQT